MSDDLRARMRAVFRPKDSSVKLSGSAKAPYGRSNVGSAKENAVTDGSGRYGVLSKEINAVTLVRPFSTNNKASQRENTLCSVCGAGGDLWTLGPVTVHEECASRLPKPGLAEPSAAYQATPAEPDGTACRVTIIEIPAKGLRFRRTFAHLQLRPPAYIPEDRWRQAIEDGRVFLSKWGETAQQLGWNSADLFGLHAVPERPHQSYRRLSRYDCTGLCWLLEGRPVVALTADTAAIESPATGNITTYRRFNKPALGLLGDSLDDLDSRWRQ
jgi:hypothetical protein